MTSVSIAWIVREEIERMLPARPSQAVHTETLRSTDTPPSEADMTSRARDCGSKQPVNRTTTTAIAATSARHTSPHSNDHRTRLSVVISDARRTDALPRLCDDGVRWREACLEHRCSLEAERVMSALNIANSERCSQFRTLLSESAGQRGGYYLLEQLERLRSMRLRHCSDRPRGVHARCR